MTEQFDEQELMTIAHVCSVLGITRATLWRWRKDGGDKAPPAVIVGGSVRFPRGWFLEWLRARAQAA